MTCKAIREGDEMACSCGLRWDIDDEDRPQCPADLDGTPYNPAVEGVDLMEHTQSLLNPKPDHDVAKEALAEMHHIVEETKS
jgi:hypothetical protein